jgi:hypothetical protein
MVMYISRSSSPDMPGWQRKSSKGGKIIAAVIGFGVVAVGAGLYAGHKGYSASSIVRELRHAFGITVPKGKNGSVAIKGNTTEGYFLNHRPENTQKLASSAPELSQR